MYKDYLTLKRASASRPSGEWDDDDFDVLADGVVVGRIFNSNAGPVGSPLYPERGQAGRTSSDIRLCHKQTRAPHTCRSAANSADRVFGSEGGTHEKSSTCSDL